MKSSEALDEIWRIYQVTVDCLRVAARTVGRKDRLLLLRDTRLVSLPDDVARRQIASGRLEVDDYLLLSLWAVFERQIYSHVQRESRRMLGKGASSFTSDVQRKVELEMEYWRIDDVFDMLKGVLGSESVGYARRIKRCWDWLAHKNPRKGSPGTVSPRWAYETLSGILSRLEEHPHFLPAGREDERADDATHREGE